MSDKIIAQMVVRAEVYIMSVASPLASQHVRVFCTKSGYEI